MFWHEEQKRYGRGVIAVLMVLLSFAVFVKLDHVLAKGEFETHGTFVSDLEYTVDAAKFNNTRVIKKLRCRLDDGRAVLVERMLGDAVQYKEGAAVRLYYAKGGLTKLPYFFRYEVMTE